jgi:hypothetical protein
MRKPHLGVPIRVIDKNRRINKLLLYDIVFHDPQA